ncbi:glycosyltransferase [Kitasatospora sp. LaBMicrA B282]|uniref:glycosyltransferase n=1 Tax=Kitasatospora sp. LaBMicrA B282 TaxID=3420949 RepID=UPI003D1247E2
MPTRPPTTTRPLTCLFVVPPLTGHLHPAAALAAELTRRGHRIAWVGPEPVLREHLGPAALVRPTGSRLFRPQAAGGEAALRTLWEGFVLPYARFTGPAVDRAVAELAPDLVLVDQHAPAGALAAHRHRVPWVSLAPSVLELDGPPGDRPGLVAWQQGLLRELWRRAGLPPAEYADPRSSPLLLLACTGPALTGPWQRPAHQVPVGPLLGPRPAVPQFPWARLDPARRAVLVTLGTLAAELAADFHHRAAAALRPLADQVQGVLVAPGGGPAAAEHLLVVDRAPVLELLARGRVAGVLGHGGMNTVGEALVHGVPLVLAPIRHDQPLVAEQVVAAGAGVRVDFATAGAGELGEAVRTVLEQPGHRAAARRVGRDLLALGGVRTAADRIERAVATAATVSGGLDQ